MNDGLISRKSLLKNIDEVIEQYSYERDGVVVMDVLTCVRDMVNDMPTAYDVDKVVKQLEELKETAYECYGRASGAYVAMCNSIEIVKRGGVE